ncbi:MAG: hypothetical protein V4507_14900 [Verrucomicrobiota bacterium]
MKEDVPDIMENFQWLQNFNDAGNRVVWTSIFGGMLLLSGIAWLLIRKKKLKDLIFIPPPHHVALRALKELRKKLSEENQREFVVEVSQVIRIYIQARFGVRAPHRSTEEFLREVCIADPLLRDHQDLLEAFLTRCDFVKFAKRSVVMKEMTDLLDNAQRFVESTLSQAQAMIGKEK